MFDGRWIDCSMKSNAMKVNRKRNYFLRKDKFDFYWHSLSMSRVQSNISIVISIRSASTQSNSSKTLFMLVSKLPKNFRLHEKSSATSKVNRQTSNTSHFDIVLRIEIIMRQPRVCHVRSNPVQKPTQLNHQSIDIWKPFIRMQLADWHRLVDQWFFPVSNVELVRKWKLSWTNFWLTRIRLFCLTNIFLLILLRQLSIPMC